MSKIAKTLDRVIRGDTDANIRFADLRALLSHLGFAERVRGDHHIFSREDVVEILNLQPKGNLAKAYQVRQVRDVLTTYGLAGSLGTANPANENPDTEQTEEADGD